MKLFNLIIILFTCYSTSAAMSEAEFNSVIQVVLSSYEDELEKSGKEVKTDINWKSEVPNASVSIKSDQIQMIFHGEFPRRFNLSSDAYAITVCHEIGHILGGYPKVMPTQKYTSEAQADYFATRECFKKYSKLIPNLKVDTTILSIEQRALCDGSPSCLRGLVAISITANAYPEESHINKYSDAVAEITNYNDYPSAQCRVDTLRAGLHCGTSECTAEKTARPKCWYKEDLTVDHISYQENYNYEEALIIGLTGKVEFTSWGCKVEVSDISYFMPSYIGPIDEDDLWSSGFQAIGPCPFERDSDFSGTITGFRGNYYYNLQQQDK